MSTLTIVTSKIKQFETKYGRTPNSVKLLAVSKQQEVSKIIALYNEGQRAFAENYLQESLAKIPLLPSDIEWHFIGPIQSNKTKKIAEHFSWVESVSSIKQLKRLNEQRPVSLPPLNICIEVNIDQEETKSGVRSGEVLELAKCIATLSQLKLRGLMCIPSMSNTDAFKKLKELFDLLIAHHFEIDTLSMGMSDDFEAAIRDGSTQVRIGRALFGARS